MDVIVERQGALDVHKEQVTACVRVPDESGERVADVAEFKTTVRGLLVLRDWLKAHRVTHVPMEATGVYWKPVCHVLEDQLELVLVNPRHVKQVPGRKTDVKDAEWLCQLAEGGLLKASFVPPKAIRALRQLTRYRKAQISERSREANPLHKALEARASSSTASRRTSSADLAGDARSARGRYNRPRDLRRPCEGEGAREDPDVAHVWPLVVFPKALADRVGSSSARSEGRRAAQSFRVRLPGDHLPQSSTESSPCHPAVAGIS